MLSVTEGNQGVAIGYFTSSGRLAEAVKSHSRYWMAKQGVLTGNILPFL